MAKTRQQKEETVKSLADKLGRAKVVVFADYKGLTMKQLSDLRDKLRDQQAEFSITKNTLLKLALQSTVYSLQSAAEDGRLKTEDILNGPTATLFAYEEEITPIKALVKTIKESAIGTIKGGFWGELILTSAKVMELSTLPSKEELKGQIVRVLVAPLVGMVNVLKANLSGLALVLNQIRIRKGGE